MKSTRPLQLELPLPLREQQTGDRAHLSLAGRIVSYTIRRSRRRRGISILIDEGGVRVGVPWDARQGAIERLLRTHADWVLRKLDEWQGRRAPVRHWAEGEPLMLFGNPLALKLEPGAEGVLLRDSALCVAPCAGAPGAVPRQVEQWLRVQALECFRERVEHYRQLLGVALVPQVKLSNARSRWGSCHRSGRIHLNWRLVQMPPRLIDYVIAHEVAHLFEMNHSQRFWRTVERALPDYAARRSELRRDAHRYLLV